MDRERAKITALFEEVGRYYQEKGIAKLDLNQGHDIHAFYRLMEEKSKVIHVQGYLGMSTEEQARVYARLMDYNKMMAIRKAGGVSIGNEHRAVVKSFLNFEFGVMIPYEAKVLEEKLAENVPELKNPKNSYST